jgi:16S rRNA (cytosine967-C5)-methyltransferase
MKSSRQLAAEALLGVERGGYSQLVFDAKAKNSALSERDTQFAAALFYGTLERRVTLDHCIARYARHPLTDTVAVILRMAFYQLIYLDSVPAHAAVDEAVRLTRTMRQPAAAGMVNGVLRSFLRDGCKIPAVKGSCARRLAIDGSCSEELASCLLDWYGEDAARAILEASFGRPPVYLRVNPLKTTPDALLSRLAGEGCDAAAHPALANCLEVRAGDPAHTAAHREGLFHIQDFCSQRAALTLAARPGDRVLDVCAAPGSKSFTVAEEMANTGTVLSCDVSENRLKKIPQGANRLGLTCIGTRQNDGSVYCGELGLFDRVLCDVPCSGLGVLRRKPEIKLRDRASFAGLPALQYKILSVSANYLKAGGTLVYSTCTINPEENERVVTQFLREHHDFAPLPFAGDDWAVTNLPAADGGDGFFIARIRRNL